MSYFDGLTILLTGGTGSFGQHFTHTALSKWDPEAIRIFSRDELKQTRWAQFGDLRLRYFIGDVRDRDRLTPRAARRRRRRPRRGAEAGPGGRVQPVRGHPTNVMGAENVIEAADRRGVRAACRAVHRQGRATRSTSTARPSCASDKLFVAANNLRRRASAPASRSSATATSSAARQRDPVLPRAADDGASADHRRAHDALLDHPRPGRRFRALRRWR